MSPSSGIARPALPIATARNSPRPRWPSQTPIGSAIAIATLALFAGAGGLGAEIYNDITFKTGIVICTVILLGMALIFDAVLVLVQARLTRWRSTDQGGGDGRHWISGFFRRDRIDTAGAGAIDL